MPMCEFGGKDNVLMFALFPLQHGVLSAGHPVLARQSSTQPGGKIHVH